MTKYLVYHYGHGEGAFSEFIDVDKATAYCEWLLEKGTWFTLFAELINSDDEQFKSFKEVISIIRD